MGYGQIEQMFRFQTGSIKSDFVDRDGSVDEAVSIPNWFD